MKYIYEPPTNEIIYITGEDVISGSSHSPDPGENDGEWIEA